MGRSIDKLLVGLNYLSGIILIFMTLSVTSEVVTRYILGKPNSWVVDLSEYSLVFMLFLSVGWTLWKGGHVGITTLTERVSGNIRRVLTITEKIVGLLVSLILLWQSIVLTIYIYKAGDLFFKALVIPKWPIFAIAPVGFFTLGLEYLRELADVVCHHTKEGHKMTA